MTLPSNKAVLVTLLLLGAAASSGAVYLDDVLGESWSENGVVVHPAEGPNGEYATVGSDGTVTIALDQPGVNPESLTVVRRVFVVENRGENWTRVWVTHQGSAAVSVLDEDTGHPVLASENSTVLEPGERVVATLRVDTRTNETTSSDVLLHEVQMHTESIEPPKPVRTPTTVTITTTVDEPDGTAKTFTVDFGPAVGGVTVSADPIPVDAVTNDDARTGEEAQIVVTRLEGGEPPPARAATTDADIVVPAGTVVTLDGTRTLVPSTSAIDTHQRIAAAVDVTVPHEYRNHPATLRFRVPREAFEDSDPYAARIGHRTDDGWHLLETRVVETTGDEVVLAARTPGFSTFAVFTDPGVSYEWTRANGLTTGGGRLQTVFPEPGVTPVWLGVTTADGTTNTSRVDVLANDEPRVEIERAETVTAGEPTTLRANVSDRYGNTSITWVLPDDRVETGPTVTEAFEPGSHTVTVHVTDEYGANATATATIHVDGPIQALVPAGDALEQLFVLASLFVGFLFLVLVLAGIVLFGSGRYQAGDRVDNHLVAAVRGEQELGSGLEDLDRPDRSGIEIGSTADRPRPDGRTPVHPVVELIDWAASVRETVMGGQWLPTFTAPTLTAPRLRRPRGPEVTAFYDPSWDPVRNRFVIGALAVEHPDRALATVEIAIVDGDGEPLARKTVNLEGQGVYRAAPELIPCVPEAAVSGSEQYAARVRVIDRQSNELTVQQSIPMPTPVTVS